jgi:hypothetical protein
MVLAAKKKRKKDNQNKSIYMNYEKVSLPKCFIPKSKFKRYIANHRAPNAQSKWKMPKQKGKDLTGEYM